MSLLAQSTPQPYYPGFRDLNLWFVGICLLVLLYVIAVAATGYRVRSAKHRMREIDALMTANLSNEQRNQLQSDRERAEHDYEVLTSAGPGRWFR